jgi:hypothetical protein
MNNRLRTEIVTITAAILVYALILFVQDRFAVRSATGTLSHVAVIDEGVSETSSGCHTAITSTDR